LRHKVFFKPGAILPKDEKTEARTAMETLPEIWQGLPANT
jgi:hypothetical protein